MFDSFTPLQMGFILIAVGIFLFFIGRAVLLWYYRINDGIYLLEEIRDELKKLNGQNIERKKENTVEETSYLELLKQGKETPKE